MKIIRFRRLYKSHWEIAFSQAHLNEKLNGEMAEIIMPAEPFVIRLFLFFFPRQGMECPNEG
jgi:hypothetical protein